jgi:CelD/BcsL family acetyltransferase involved in cellulose biosynthesis
MEVEVHHAADDAVLADWARLFATDPEATPFASPEWARAWLKHWAGSARPWIAVIHDGGEPVGIAPLMLDRRGPFRVLVPLGRPHGNYWDVVAAPDRREAAATALAAEAVRRANEWDALVVDGLPSASPTIRALRESGLHTHTRPPTGYPGLELPPTFDDYLAAMPRQRRSNLRRHLRRLEEELSHRLVSRPEELGHAVDRWHDLRVAWWRTRGKDLNPEHGTPGFRAFMQDVVTLLVPVGLAEVVEFRIGDAVVGVQVNLVDAQRFYWWLGGYDPDQGHLGLGKIAVGLGIRSSIEAGRRDFDFMIGAEDYKYWFGATDRHCEWLMLTDDRLRSRAALAASRVAERVSRRRRAR